jgi:hypothetical protein
MIMFIGMVCSIFCITKSVCFINAFSLLPWLKQQVSARAANKEHQTSKPF